MPDPSAFSTQEEFMAVCVPQCMDEGLTNEQAVGKCMGMWNEGTTKTKVTIIRNAAVKVAGDWELDVTPVPFGSKTISDSDGQWFDPTTDIMEETFSTPLVIYQHGYKQGGQGMEEKPIKIGRSMPGTLTKKSDGWHIRVQLDKVVKQAKDIMEAAWKGMVAVSSDSISHLARLETEDGRIIHYQKNRPGKIAVWPLAGFSLWEKQNGNFSPANHRAIALPAMKAFYREAGLAFPDVATKDTNGVPSYTDEVLKRARVRTARDQADQILKRIKDRTS